MCEEERKKKKVVGCVTWCFFLFVEKLYKPPKVDGDERKGGPPFLTSTPGRRSSQMKTSAPLHLFIFSFYEMCCVGGNKRIQKPNHRSSFPKVSKEMRPL
jgi:hypothetical protein